MAHAAQAPPGFSAITADAVTVLRTLRERADVSATLDGLRIVHAWDVAGVCAALEKSGATVVVATLQARDGVRVDDVMATVRRRGRRVEVVIVGAPNEVTLNDATAPRHVVVTALAPGGSASREELRAVVTAAQPRIQLRAIAHRVADLVAVEEEDRRVVRYFIECGDLNRAIGSAPAALGISEDTLEDRILRSTGLEAHELRTWGRLIAAAILLTCTLWSADRIGRELGFGGGNGLCGRMRQYSRYTPAEIRESGDVEYVIGRFLEACRKAPENRPPRAQRTKRNLVKASGVS
jgi:hypothetical protein